MPSTPSAMNRAAKVANVSSSAGFVTSVGRIGPPRMEYRQRRARSSVRARPPDVTGVLQFGLARSTSTGRPIPGAPDIVAAGSTPAWTRRPDRTRPGDERTRPTVTLRARHTPLALPNSRDPRLHVAAVIITIHILGQAVLG